MCPEIMGIPTRVLRWPAIALFALMLALMSFMHVESAQASEGCLAASSFTLSTQVKKVYLDPLTVWIDSGNTANMIGVENLPRGAVITKVRSSRPAIIKAETNERDTSVLLTPLRVGESKITVTFKVGASKKTVSAICRAKKAPKAFKSIKVNGKSVDVVSHKRPEFDVYVFGYKGVKASLDVELAEGWSMSRMGARITDDDRFVRWSTINNPKNIKVDKGCNAEVVIFAENERVKGESINYTVGLFRCKEPLTLKSGLYHPGETTYLEFASPLFERVKVTSVTSSNPNVIFIAEESSQIIMCTMRANEPGASTITVEYELSGKKYKTSAECVVEG